MSLMWASLVVAMTAQVIRRTFAFEPVVSLEPDRTFTKACASTRHSRATIALPPQSVGSEDGKDVDDGQEEGGGSTRSALPV